MWLKGCAHVFQVLTSLLSEHFCKKCYVCDPQQGAKYVKIAPIVISNHLFSANKLTRAEKQNFLRVCWDLPYSVLSVHAFDTEREKQSRSNQLILIPFCC